MANLVGLEAPPTPALTATCCSWSLAALADQACRQWLRRSRKRTGRRQRRALG
jgi:hypothetical protein